MSRAQKAKEYFLSGYTCSQAAALMTIGCLRILRRPRNTNCRMQWGGEVLFGNNVDGKYFCKANDIERRIDDPYFTKGKAIERNKRNLALRKRYGCDHFRINDDCKLEQVFL